MPGSYTANPRLGADPAMPDGDAKNVAAFRALLDAHAHLRLVGSGALAWSGDLAVAGTHDAPAVTVGAIQSVNLVLADGSEYQTFYYPGGTVGAAAVEAGGDLAPDTWYYVYAKPGSGGGGTACEIELSITAPHANRVYKGAGNTFPLRARRYLGCFPTDSSGDPFPLRAVRGNYLYVQATAEGVYTAADTLVSLAGRVPPHTRHAICRASVKRGSSTGALTGHVIEPPADAASPVSRRAWGVSLASVGVDDTVNGTFEVLTNSSREVRVVGGGADSPLTLAIEGFRE